VTTAVNRISLTGAMTSSAKQYGFVLTVSDVIENRLGQSRCRIRGSDRTADIRSATLKVLRMLFTWRQHLPLGERAPRLRRVVASRPASKIAISGELIGVLVSEPHD
jgi:hypothetical protein